MIVAAIKPKRVTDEMLQIKKNSSMKRTSWKGNNILKHVLLNGIFFIKIIILLNIQRRYKVVWLWPGKAKLSLTRWLELATHLEITLLSPCTRLAIFTHEKWGTIKTFHAQILPKIHRKTLSKTSSFTDKLIYFNEIERPFSQIQWGVQYSRLPTLQSDRWR